MMQQVRWGIIGCGNVVKKKSGKAFVLADGSGVAAVCSRTGRHAEQTAKELGAKRWYISAEELLTDPEVDAVYIATPPGLHLEHALSCCEAGKPVYLEKPFARSFREAVQITEAFEQKALPLFVAHYYRAHPRFRFLKEKLQEGVIGKPVSVRLSVERKYEQSAWHHIPELSGGGKFYDIAPHSLDILQYLLGGFQEIQGYAGNAGGREQTEDTVVMAFRTEQGVLGTADYMLDSAHKCDEAVIHGTEGQVSFSIHGERTLIFETKEGVETIRFEEEAWQEQAMVQEVVNALRGKEHMAVTGREALNVMQAMDQALWEYYGGRNDAFWERPDTWGKRDC